MKYVVRLRNKNCVVEVVELPAGRYRQAAVEVITGAIIAYDSVSHSTHDMAESMPCGIRGVKRTRRPRHAGRNVSPLDDGAYSWRRTEERVVGMQSRR